MQGMWSDISLLDPLIDKHNGLIDGGDWNYQTSERGANISGPEPNPNKKVVMPNVETVAEQL